MNNDNTQFENKPDGYMADGTPVYLKLSGDSSACSLQLALYKLLTEKEDSDNG